MADTDPIKLERVRLSFPDIWKAKSMTDGGDPKFSAAFLLDKKGHEELIKKIKKIIWNLALDAFKTEDRAKDVVAKKMIALHEGSEKTYDGYNESNMFVSASSTRRPAIIDRDRTPLAEDDRKPYAGCYVNAVVQFWPQNNNFGKRINCELLGIQFVSDGEPFGKPPFNPDEHFDKLDPDKKTAGKKASNEAEPPPSSDEDEIPF